MGYLPNYKSDNLGSNKSGEEEDERYIRIQEFCLSSGFYKKKFSANSIASLYFMVPERIAGKCEKGDMGKSDMWAVGALIYCLVFGETPFEANTSAVLVKHIKRNKLSKLKGFLRKTQPGALKYLFCLITKLMEEDPDQRLDAAQALSHDFFTKGKENKDFEMSLNVDSLSLLKKCWL